MSQEIETAAVDALASGWRGGRRKAKGHAHPPEGKCANCGVTLLGPWCHACGQTAEDFHRSAFKLVAEVIEGLLHFDGRLWRTLPDLAFRPGRLTRSYLDGHRAPQIPPLRLFLVVLLLVFFTGSIAGRDYVHFNPAEKTKSVDADGKNLSPDKKEALKAGLSKVNVKLGGGDADRAATNWLQSRLKSVIDEPERFKLVLESWGERFAFLMLPLSALLLSMVMAFRKGVYLFDHVIFSLHSLSFQGLLACVFLLLPSDWNGWVLLAAPVHLFFHLKSVYGVSLIGALVRMGFLFVGALVGIVLIGLGLIAIGLSQMG